jgi:N-acetyl sugar amidotransferase
MDITVPEVRFDSEGVCNYCKLHEKLCEDYPNDERGDKILNDLVEKMRKAGKNRNYDVVVGVSGGTDSTYLCHLAKTFNLKILAVHLDCGWNSEIAVSNIKNSLDKLGIDLFTYVVNWEEIKDLYRSVMKARVPWIDGVTDIAILGSLYKIAAKFNVKYIWVGNNFRTEGRQPDAWTDFDARILNAILKQFGISKSASYPNFTPFHMLYYGFLRGIKMVRPFYFIKYNKAEAKKFLAEKYDWKDYGGHHHESIFTRYTIGVWLTQKFGIDKRKVTFSAYIRSGEMSRSEALRLLKEPAYDVKKMDDDKEYIIKKLGFTEAEFDAIWQGANRRNTDYPSYEFFYKTLKGAAVFIFKFILPWKPMMFYDPKNYNR